jgi:predicted dehydrogenase
MQKMISEKKGNVMVTAGNNRKKTTYIREALNAGINVLADKPMTINTDDFQMLKECFEIAEKNGLLLYDIMTERFDIASIMQREFSLIPTVYGQQLPGTFEEPGVVRESVHHFLKTVSGAPLIRPAWFFDVEQQGNGVIDVTTHLVDLVQWACFPNQILNYRTDVELLDANRWPTEMTLEQFGKVTNLNQFPDYLQKDIKDGILRTYSNGDISYKLKGIHAKVSVVWNYTFPEGGGDTHYSIMRGSKSNLIIEQGEETNFIPSLSIRKTDSSVSTADFERDLTASMSMITAKYPGVTITQETDDTWRVNIPGHYYIGHEAHFGRVAENFLQYLSENKLPDWEVPNMISKYYTTTHALEIAKSKENK